MRVFHSGASTERSEPVVDDVNLDACSRALGQRLGEFSTDDIVAENIHLEEDRPLRFTYRLKPGREIFRGIAQKANGVTPDRIGACRARERAIGEREREFWQFGGIVQINPRRRERIFATVDVIVPSKP